MTYMDDPEEKLQDIETILTRLEERIDQLPEEVAQQVVDEISEKIYRSICWFSLIFLLAAAAAYIRLYVLRW